MFGELNSLKVLMGLRGRKGSYPPKRVESLLSSILLSQKSVFKSLKHVKKRSYGSSGSLKAEVVDENTLRPILGLDLVCVPNLVVVGPAVFAKKHEQTDRHPMNHIY